MKYTLKCPKCQSDQVINPKGSKYHASQQIVLDTWGAKTAKISRYICTHCGFTEEWVDLNDKFNNWVDKNWDKLMEEME